MEPIGPVVTNELLIYESIAFLRKIVDTMDSKPLQAVCRLVLDDGVFVYAAASAKKHQAYEGGLAVHTAEVLDTALRIAASPHLKANRDVLITATIYHDYGKIFDYRRNPDAVKVALGSEPEFIYAEHRHLIRHLSRS